MSIDPVNQGASSIPTSGKGSRARLYTQSNAQRPPKKDSLFISEKARDLAAKQAGKAAQEEANESAGTKIKEGSAD
jgi:hypothetical protein